MCKELLIHSNDTNTMVQPIINYLKEEKSDYCVLIDGKWGCGKTFYIKNRFQDEVLNIVKKKLSFI